MDSRIDALIGQWRRHNISGEYCRTPEEALQRIEALVPAGSTAGVSGSVTLTELGVHALMERRLGDKFLNPYKPGLSREEGMLLRASACRADCYLASPNAIAADGTMVFLSAFSNRIVGVSEAKSVVLVAGTNKLAGTVDEALKRGREAATPLNCRRLSWPAACAADGICRREECAPPQYKRMCCQTLLLEAEITPGRVKVVLVEGNYGF